MTYGDGDGVNFGPLVSLDVAGHEMIARRHREHRRADLLRRVRRPQRGHLGHLRHDGGVLRRPTPTTRATTSIGEEFDLKNHAGFRRMDNPIADGSSPNCYSTNTKNLDVHYSSGVGNHFFYLLAEGSGAKTINGVAHSSPTCNGSTITGIGRDAAAADLVPRADGLHDLGHDLLPGPHRDAERRQGPLRRRLHAARTPWPPPGARSASADPTEPPRKGGPIRGGRKRRGRPSGGARTDSLGAGPSRSAAIVRAVSWVRSPFYAPKRHGLSRQAQQGGGQGGAEDDDEERRAQEQQHDRGGQARRRARRGPGGGRWRRPGPRPAPTAGRPGSGRRSGWTTGARAPRGHREAGQLEEVAAEPATTIAAHITASRPVQQADEQSHATGGEDGYAGRGDRHEAERHRDGEHGDHLVARSVSCGHSSARNAPPTAASRP